MCYTCMQSLPYWAIHNVQKSAMDGILHAAEVCLENWCSQTISQMRCLRQASLRLDYKLACTCAEGVYKTFADQPGHCPLANATGEHPMTSLLTIYSCVLYNLVVPQAGFKHSANCKFLWIGSTASIASCQRYGVQRIITSHGSCSCLCNHYFALPVPKRIQAAKPPL